jgi:hypothetical protein
MVREGLLIFVVLASGCVGVQSDGAIDTDPNSTENMSIEEMKRASDVSQCVKVPDGPCGCSMGGGSIAINGEYRDEYMEQYQPEDADQVACPAVYQCHRSLALEDGKCTLVFNESKMENGSLR